MQHTVGSFFGIFLIGIKLASYVRLPIHVAMDGNLTSPSGQTTN